MPNVLKLRGKQGESRKEDIKDVIQHMEGEARMILPGIQALFGFQLIAIFNQRFTELLPGEQKLHLAALFCTALSVAFVLAPAAYHRQAEPEEISSFLCRFGSRMLTLALAPLLVGTALDLYVIVRLVTASPGTAAALSGMIFLLYTGLWFVFPNLRRRWT